MPNIVDWSNPIVESPSSSRNHDNNGNDNNNTTASTETTRLSRQDRPSFSSIGRTFSGGTDESNQSFTDRRQILTRQHQRRVTLSPNPDEDGQEFGWGSLVSTLNGTNRGDEVDNELEHNGNYYDEGEQGGHEAGDGIGWHGTGLRGERRGGRTRTRTPQAGEYVNEIATLRYNLDNESRGSVDDGPYPPPRSPRRLTATEPWLRGTGSRPTSNDGRGMVNTTTTYSRDGASHHQHHHHHQTTRHDPDVLSWHDTASPRSQYSPEPLRIQSQQSGSQQVSHQGAAQPSLSETRDLTTTSTPPAEGRGSSDDNAMIEEVVRTIHASRAGPFLGMSHVVDDDGNRSVRSRSLDGSSYGEEQLLPGQGIWRDSTRIPRLNYNLYDSHSNNNSNSFLGSSAETGRAAHAQSTSDENNMEQQQQQQHQFVPHLPRRTVNSSTTTPTKDGSVPSYITPSMQQTSSKSTNNDMTQGTHGQGDRGARRTSITRLPGASLVDVPRRGSDVARHFDSRRQSTNLSRYDAFPTPPLDNTDEIQERVPGKTDVIGAAAVPRQPGMSKIPTANTVHDRNYHPALDHRHHHNNNITTDPTQPSSRDFANTTTNSGDEINKDGIYQTDRSNNQIRPVAGLTSSSSPSVPPTQQHSGQHRDDVPVSNEKPTTTTTGPGGEVVPPASTHHGQHAIFANLPEPEKAHHHNRGPSARFRPTSMSTVGSTFKPGTYEQRRQSSVTVLGDDHEPRPHTERTRDEAWDFLLRNRTGRIVDVGRQPSYLRRLRWRIDLHLMVWLFLAYLVTFCDKILWNYARVMGILTELHFTTNDWANASSYFYVASLVFSLPNIWLLAKMPLGKLLAIDLIGWGICTATYAALRNWGGLVALRVLGGAFEAGILPCLILLTGQYFTRREQPIRFAFWTSGVAIGQMLSGLLSWAFQQMSPRDHLSSWKTMYLLLGLLTVILGFFIFFFVPDTPMRARFLNTEEKVALLEHVKVNQTGIANRRFHFKQIFEGIFDLGCWLLGIMVVLQLISAGVTMFYSVTMLHRFGYSAERSALLNMPSGAINLVCIFLYAIFVRYFGMRWVVVCFAGIISTIGAALLFGLTSYGDNRRALLAGIYLLNFAPGATMIVLYWLSCNVAGHTKRAYAAAAMNVAYALGAIIGSQSFRHQAVPGYRSAKLTLVITMAMTVVLAPLTAGYFWYRNRRRDRKYEGTRIHEDDMDDATAYAGLTDKQNKSFRYRW